MYSRLSRISTARQLDTRFSLVGTTKIQAFKSFVFNQKFPIFENNPDDSHFLVMTTILSFKSKADACRDTFAWVPCTLLNNTHDLYSW